jgi:hypothetical protein
MKIDNKSIHMQLKKLMIINSLINHIDFVNNAS